MQESLIQLISEWSQEVLTQLQTSAHIAESYLASLDVILTQYLRQLEQLLPSPPEIYVIVGIYIERLSRVSLFSDFLMPHALLPLISLAHKFLFDNSTPTRILSFGTCRVRDLIDEEFNVLKLLNWNLYVSNQQFVEFKSRMDRAWLRRLQTCRHFAEPFSAIPSYLIQRPSEVDTFLNPERVELSDEVHASLPTPLFEPSGQFHPTMEIARTHPVSVDDEDWDMTPNPDSWNILNAASVDLSETFVEFKTWNSAVFTYALN